MIPSCLCLLLLFRIRGNLCNLDLESLKLIFSRKLTMDNQDLISFASPNPTQKKDGHFRAELESISFDNNNDRTVEKFKAVQNLFSTPSSDPPPHPPPRAILPSVSPNGMFSYPNTTMPNLNRYQAFSSQVRQQNFTSFSNLPNQNVAATSVAGQSMFNQGINLPIQPHSSTSNSLSNQNTKLSLPSNQNSLQRANSTGSGGFSYSIPKSNSWNEEILTSTPKQNSSSSSGLRHTSPPPSIVSDIKSTTSSSSSSGRRKLQYKSKANTDSLIDLGVPGPSEGDGNTTTVSILHDFDPLNETDNEEEEEEIYWSSQKSNFSESFYDTNDPFSYMEQQAELTERISEVDDDSVDSPEPPVIPRRMVGVVRPTSFASQATIHRRSMAAINYENVVKKDRKIFENISVERKPAVAMDGEVISFIEMVTQVREDFRHDNLDTNPGIVAAVKLFASYPPHTEVKLVVDKVVFTAAIQSDLMVVIAQVLVKMDKDVGLVDQFRLKIHGQSEYLSDGQLSDYEYVHQCYKYDRDVHLTLAHKNDIIRDLARTAADDESDSKLSFNQISPLDTMKTLSFDDLRILLSTLQTEADRMSVTARTLASCSDKEVMKALRPKQMLQAVKAVASLLGGVETLELREACDQLCKSCLQFDAAKGNEDPAGRLRPEIVDEVGEKYAMVTLNRVSGTNFEKYALDISECLKSVKHRVEDLIRTYARTFRVDFEIETTTTLTPVEKRLTTDINETLLVKICCLHRLDSAWSYLDYRVDVRVYHGTKLILDVLSTPLGGPKQDHQDLHRSVTVDHWVEFSNLQISQIPLEARLVVSLVGRERLADKDQVWDQDKPGEDGLYKFTELGWASLQMFSHTKSLAQGSFLLPVWPVDANQQIGPAPDPGSHPAGDKCPLVSIVLPELGGPVQFPDNIQSLPSNQSIKFEQLDRNTRQELQDYCEQDILAFNKRPPKNKEIVWDKRHYLRGVCGALPKVLLAARSWDPKSLPSLYGLIESWPQPDIIDILQLFLPIFPDTVVRAAAVSWLSSLPSDQLLDFLPQLVEAVKHETWSASPLSRLLIERSLTCPRICHNLYWLLTQALPGVSPQVSQKSQTGFMFLCPVFVLSVLLLL